ncbi:MAG: DUF5668 domain-containing protein [Patescibacteria group bacterium]|nr:DUF5668 domain-containing protein [Patescibacteria group bacterium]
MFIALFILALGIIYLLKNLGVITVGVWNLLWPSLIIIGGITLIFKKRRQKHWWDFFDNKTREDWDRWGREFGSKMDSFGRKIERSYRTHPDEWEGEFGRRIGKKIKYFFDSDKSSEKKE